MTKNKRSKHKSSHIDILGIPFCLPKKVKKKFNKKYPSQKKVKLNISHLPKVMKIIKEEKE